MQIRDNVLKLDIDTKEGIEDRVKQWAFTLAWLDKKPRGITIYETTKGYHVYILLDRAVFLKDIMLLQALLGSDIKRERYNYSRYLNGRWENVLFARKSRLSGYVSTEQKTEETAGLENLFFSEYHDLTSRGVSSA